MKAIEIKNVKTSVGHVKLVTLRTKYLEVVLTSYGAGIYKFRYNGKDIAVSPEKLEDYLISPAYYGKTIGRHSGRLFGPSFNIDGQSYDVICDNDQPSQLHGGQKGLAFQHFTLTRYERMGDATRVTFSTKVDANTDGFPGNLNLNVSYEVTKDHALKIDYHATTSAPTLCHLTNHIYLNIGQYPHTILDHEMYVKSSYYLNIDQLYKIKQIKNSVDTPFDFRTLTQLDQRIKMVKQPDLEGYDHCFLLDNHDDLEPVYRLHNNDTKLSVDVMTNYPSIVIYTHNHPAPHALPDISTNGVHSSITMECQYPPDSIHYGSLESGILRPGKKEHKFIIIKPYVKK